MFPSIFKDTHYQVLAQFSNKPVNERKITKLWLKKETSIFLFFIWELKEISMPTNRVGDKGMLSIICVLIKVS